jgi:hypothetical protein
MRFCVPPFNVKSLLIATVFTVLAAAMSQHVGRTFSVLIDYAVSSPDSVIEGIVLRSKSIRVGRWSVLAHEIVFTYRIGNRIYHNNRVNYDLRTRDACELVKKYPVGKAVMVYYDSEKPSYSVLERGKLGLSVYFQLFVVLCVFPFSYGVSLWLNRNP